MIYSIFYCIFFKNMLNLACELREIMKNKKLEIIILLLSMLVLICLIVITIKISNWDSPVAYVGIISCLGVIFYQFKDIIKK